MARIQREFGVQLPIAVVIEARTIDALVAMIDDERPDLAHPAQPAQPGGDAASAPSAGSGSRYKPILALRAAGSRQPLFVVHGATGEVLFLHNLVRHLDPDRPVYGIHAIGNDSRDRPDPSVEAMVDRYIDALIAEHAEPYLLGGYSGGGIIVIEMARQLQERGKQVTAVILFDCVARGRVPWSRRLVWSNVAKHLITSGPTAIRPYLSQRLGSRLRRIAPVSRRVQGTATTDGDGTGMTIDLFGHFTEIAARFEMRAVDADVILLKAEQSWPALPGDYYWTPYVNGVLRIEYVGGHHNSMFDAANAPGLGRRVETIIAEYE
jgi:thioesterase domain-containing protein